MPATGIDSIEVAFELAFALVITAPEYVSEPENSIHGRTDLVADVGEELTLSAVGGLCLILGLLHLHLLLLQLGNIVEADECAPVLALVNRNRRAIHEESAELRGAVAQVDHLVAHCPARDQ